MKRLNTHLSELKNEDLFDVGPLIDLHEEHSGRYRNIQYKAEVFICKYPLFTSPARAYHTPAVPRSARFTAAAEGPWPQQAIR